MKNEVGCVSLGKYARKIKLVRDCYVLSCQDILCASDRFLGPTTIHDPELICELLCPLFLLLCGDRSKSRAGTAAEC